MAPRPKPEAPARPAPSCSSDALRGWQRLPAEHALLGLGANLGAREETLERALEDLAERLELTVVARSSWHTTAPVGGPPGQDDFKNGVALVRTPLSPEALLHGLQAVELLHGRTRDLEWGPRTLDLDLLMMAGEVRATETLALPHPRMCERAFVLAPLAELMPELQVATGETVATALARLDAAGRGSG